MRRTALVIALSAATLAGLASGGVAEAGAATAGRTITRNFVAQDSGQSPFFLDDRFPPLIEFNQDRAYNTQRLFGYEAAAKAALEKRPGVKSVKASCSRLHEGGNGPFFQPELDNPKTPAHEGIWLWKVYAAQTCTFTIRR